MKVLFAGSLFYIFVLPFLTIIGVNELFGMEWTYEVNTVLSIILFYTVILSFLFFGAFMNVAFHGAYEKETKKQVVDSLLKKYAKKYGNNDNNLH